MRRKRSSRRPRKALLTGVLAFIIFQMGFGLATEVWCPRYRDPEYGTRLSILKSRLGATSDGPFTLIMLGSSRTVRGFRPAVVEPVLKERLQRPVVAFNFGMTGAGPLLEMLTLR